MKYIFLILFLTACGSDDSQYGKTLPGAYCLETGPCSSVQAVNHGWLIQNRGL